MKYRYYAEGYNKSHLVYVDGFTWPSGDIWETDKAACDTAAKRLRDKYPEVDFNMCCASNDTSTHNLPVEEFIRSWDHQEDW